ncbi:MAG: M24 family metallopeptidase [Actinomycetota bacterium]
MTTYLVYDDSIRSRELRHEIGEAIGDPVTFIEHEGRRIAVCSSNEVPILARREDVIDDCWGNDQFGSEELALDESFPEHLIGAEIVSRTLEKLGVTEVNVPRSFQLAVADHLRSRGIKVTVDHNGWVARMRRKTPWEIEGIERAQRAAETAMLTAARLLREAEPTSEGLLRFEGEILTAELIRAAMTTELLNQEAYCDDILVQSGTGYGGHDPGSGPIQPNRTVIIDVFPSDRRTSVYSDMTRTFVPGEPSEEVRRMHAHVREALGVAFKALKPGSADAFRKVCEFFHSKGYETQLHKADKGSVKQGFTHALGHGIGLVVHDYPAMGRRSGELVVGDVVAVEPGLYINGVGGIRLEDTVLITQNGVEHFTDPYPYDLSP